MSRWLAKGIVILLMLPFIWALSEIFRFRFKLNIFSKKNRKSFKNLGIIVIVVYVGMFFISMYFLGKGTYFGHNTGEIMKWYADTPEGNKYYDSPGVDPVYGIKLKPVTSDLVINNKKKELGIKPNRITDADLDKFEFFDSNTAAPKVWVYRNAEGDYELFDHPGFHPKFKEELLPVTPEIVDQIMKKYDEAKKKKELIEQSKVIEQANKIDQERTLIKIANISKYINVSSEKAKNKKSVSILSIDENVKENNDVEQIIASSLISNGYAPISNFFKVPFINDGKFENLYMGDMSVERDLNLSAYFDYLILCKKKTNFNKQTDLNDIISASMIIEIRIIDVRNGQIIKSDSISTIGAGFSNAEAEKKAVELLNKKMPGYLKEEF
jgi:hypothetical protein